jgi:ferredoxin
MRIAIDPGRCSGHGRCYAVAPMLFADDERGYGRVIGDGFIGAEQQVDAERAVVACPERAVRLYDTGTG